MKTTRELSRWSLAQHLQDVALRIAAGKPVRIGGVSVLVPDRVVVEEEVQTKDGETELEFELKWPTAPVQPLVQTVPVATRRRRKRRKA